MVLVVTTLPDRAVAERLARRLVESRLAACVGLAPTASIYHWRGQVETADEVTLTAKTLASRYREAEAAILAEHPYELPEILAIPVTDGHLPYLRWIEAETTPPRSA